MGPQEFLKAAARLREAPVVLVVGASATLAEWALSLVAADDAAGVERVGAGEGQLREACELALTPPFFFGRRIVAAWRAGALSGQEGRGARERQLEAQALLDYVEHPPDGATLFVWAAQADQRLAPVRRAASRGWLLAADPGKELAPWLRELGLREGVALSPQATRAFLESGLELDSLATALRTAAMATPDGAEVAGDVAAWAAPPSAEMRVFALTDAILQRRESGVGQVLRQLTAQGEAPLGLLGLVARQMRQLATVRAELAAGRPPQELAQILGAHPFVAQKLREVAPHWSEAAVAQAFRELLRCDLALKSGGSQSLALELGLVRVARATG